MIFIFASEEYLFLMRVEFGDDLRRCRSIGASLARRAGSNLFQAAGEKGDEKNEFN